MIGSCSYFRLSAIKKATQVFDTIGVVKDLSGFQPLAAGGSVTLKRKKPL